MLAIVCAPSRLPEIRLVEGMFWRHAQLTLSCNDRINLCNLLAVCGGHFRFHRFLSCLSISEPNVAYCEILDRNPPDEIKVTYPAATPPPGRSGLK